MSNGEGRRTADSAGRAAFQQETYRTVLARQERFAFFFLAASGSAIGLALAKTDQGPPAVWMMPVGLAVVCWGVSFYLGCEHLLHQVRVVLANFRTLDIEQGTEPITASNPELAQPALERLRANADRDNVTSRRFGRGQFVAFLLGAVFYVLGHVQRICS